MIRPSPAWEGDSIFYTGGRPAGCADLAAADLTADLRRDWRTGGHDTGRRLRVLSVGDPRASQFRRHSRRRQPLVGRDRRRHRQGPWSAPSPDPRRRHRQPPDRCRRTAGRSRISGSADDGSELHVRNLENGSDAMIEGEPGVNRGFPAISPSGQRLAYSAVVPGPPVQRPLFLTSIAGGETRLVRNDCGGRPRLWLDEQTLLIETFGSGLNAFLIVDMRDGAQRPLLSAATRKVSNPRISPDGRWLAFDATQPGGSPRIAIAPLRRDTPVQESEWIVIRESASHPFWSRDGRVLYYLATFPNIDIRSRVRPRLRHVDRSRRQRGHADLESHRNDRPGNGDRHRARCRTRPDHFRAGRLQG